MGTRRNTVPVGLVVLLAGAAILAGCTSTPRKVSRAQFNKASQRASSLSGYQRAYLGSDETYHYVRISCATRSKEYKVKKDELFIINPYAYFPAKSRAESLEYKIGSNPPRSQNAFAPIHPLY